MDKLLSKSLTGTDITNSTNGQIKILTYPELTKYNDIDDAFGNHNGIALLYPFSGDGVKSGLYGHWTLLTRNNRPYGPEIEFFDSYNYKPDDELKFAKDDYRNKTKMRLPHLTKLLLGASNKGYNIEYNDNKHQNKNKNISTCGRHIIVRHFLRNLDIDQYDDLMNQLKKQSGLSIDEIVTYLTKEI